MKSGTRAWLVAFLLAPATCVKRDAPADAAGGAREVALPHGLHFRDGRYFEDVCDRTSRFFCFSQRLLPVDFEPRTYTRGEYAAPNDDSGPPSGSMTPTDVLTAYKIPTSSSAGGKIVALVDMPDASALKDLNTYRQAFGIPALPQCTGTGLPDPSGGTPCFASVDEKGGSINQNVGDDQQGDMETGLDLDMISASCPDCSILLVQMTEPAISQVTDMDLLTAAQTGGKLGAQAVSISFGGSEGGSDPKGFTTPGHLVLAAAGDSGYLLGGNTLELARLPRPTCSRSAARRCRTRPGATRRSCGTTALGAPPAAAAVPSFRCPPSRPPSVWSTSRAARPIAPPATWRRRLSSAPGSGWAAASRSTTVTAAGRRWSVRAPRLRSSPRSSCGSA